MPPRISELTDSKREEIKEYLLALLILHLNYSETRVWWLTVANYQLPSPLHENFREIAPTNANTVSCSGYILHKAY